MQTFDEYYMQEAIRLAEYAATLDEVPIGCVIVKDNHIIGRGYNLRESRQSSTAHAEILAIAEANQTLHSWRLEGCTLYVTLEPCPMCSGAILLSRMERVVYGAKDPKGGCLESCMKMYETPGFNHYPSVHSGLMEGECASLLKKFFKEKRRKQKTKTSTEQG